MSVVLLSGHLDEARLCRVQEEIWGGLDNSCVLVIDSLGGDLQPTVDFVEEMLDSVGVGRTVFSSMRIYNAESAAALISLALPAAVKEMREGAILGVHRGSVILDTSDLDLVNGSVANHATLALLRRHEATLKEALVKRDLSSDPKLMAELYGSNWLHLSAEECLRRGIVTRL